MKPNETLYGALRYDGERRPLRDLIRRTYVEGLDLVPGNLELMEFEHETPRILAQGSRGAQSLFYARAAEALDSVAEDYDLVVLDCRRSSASLRSLARSAPPRRDRHRPSADAGPSPR